MAKKLKLSAVARALTASGVLTQRDADRFEGQGKKYAATFTTSKKKAQNKLFALGIYTRTGKLTKKYG